MTMPATTICKDCNKRFKLCSTDKYYGIVPKKCFTCFVVDKTAFKILSEHPYIAAGISEKTLTDTLDTLKKQRREENIAQWQNSLSTKR